MKVDGRIRDWSQKAVLYYGIQVFTRSVSFVCLALGLFSPCHVASWILVSQQRVKPVPPAVEAWSPNHWTSGNSLEHLV